jgi:hypothetical protein
MATDPAVSRGRRCLAHNRHGWVRRSRRPLAVHGVHPRFFGVHLPRYSTFEQSTTRFTLPRKYPSSRPVQRQAPSKPAKPPKTSPGVCCGWGFAGFVGFVDFPFVGGYLRELKGAHFAATVTTEPLPENFGQRLGTTPAQTARCS